MSTAPSPLLFHYEHSRRQQARAVLINMALLPAVLWLLLQLIDDPAAHQRWTGLLLGIGLLAELAMAALAAWLLSRPASFSIRLSAREFSSHHPMFKAWCFSVDPAEIVAIEQSTDREADGRYISILTRDGQRHALSPNYGYDRRALYQALAALHPAIRLPKHPGLFSRQP
jgi:hypothetical protein